MDEATHVIETEGGVFIFMTCPGDAFASWSASKPTLEQNIYATDDAPHNATRKTIARKNLVGTLEPAEAAVEVVGEPTVDNTVEPATSDEHLEAHLDASLEDPPKDNP
ncbi:hypothetical protein BBP40_011275 [Aspergillus hancockii]|nr:hypothetical protein BBP40_011275 [Aspergillus hancockii]